MSQSIVTSTLDAPLRIGILGGTNTAVGLALLCARRGCVATLVASDSETSRVLLMAELSNALKAGTITESEVADLLAAITFSTEETELADRQFVFDLQLIPGSDPDAALARIARLERQLVDPDATLLVESCALPHSQVAAAAADPSRVLGVRLFTPVGVMPLMELVTAPSTAPEVAFKAGSFITAILGNHLLQSLERPLFTAQALPIPYVVSAIRIHEGRLTNTDDIDDAHIPGCTRPIGPLEFADLLGLDTLHDVVQRLHQDNPEANLQPPQTLSTLVERGHLGRKSGRGFFRYPTTHLDVEVIPAGRPALVPHPA